MELDLNFNNYQVQAGGTDLYSEAISERVVSTIFGDSIRLLPAEAETIKREFNALYLVLGLGGEAGEVAEKFKKHLRDRSTQGFLFETDSEFKQQVAYELGDVCWYVAKLADLLGYDYKDIHQMNLDKLEARRIKNTIHGSGDGR